MKILKITSSHLFYLTISLQECTYILNVTLYLIYQIYFFLANCIVRTLLIHHSNNASLNKDGELSLAFVDFSSYRERSYAPRKITYMS